MAHGIARLSPNYCCDSMRFWSIGQTEAYFWHHNVLSVADRRHLPERDEAPGGESFLGLVGLNYAHSSHGRRYCALLIHPWIPWLRCMASMSLLSKLTVVSNTGHRDICMRMWRSFAQ